MTPHSNPPPTRAQETWTTPIIRLVLASLFAAVALLVASAVPVAEAVPPLASIGSDPDGSTGIISSGTDHTCALFVGGTATCWGDNTFGQLGNGTFTGSAVAVAVSLPAGTASVAIAAGDIHSCAVLDDGTATCWGDNSSGQLGNGTVTESNVPVTVDLPTGTAPTAIAAGYSHTCAILDDGTATCWGDNSSGQLGNGTTTSSDTPVAVDLPAGTTARAITAGNLHSCAILDDGTATCWGDNFAGQLGNGTTTESDVPVPVSLTAGTTAIAAGAFHTCAILDDGTARCWGDNLAGALGDGSTTTSDDPAVVGLPAGTTVAAIASGDVHTCAVLDDGTATCWGDNLFGQLGNGTTTDTNSPVTVDCETNITCAATATTTTTTTTTTTPSIDTTSTTVDTTSTTVDTGTTVDTTGTTASTSSTATRSTATTDTSVGTTSSATTTAPDGNVPITGNDSLLVAALALLAVAIGGLTFIVSRRRPRST